MSSATRRLDAVIDRYVGDKIVGTNVIFSLGGEVVYARAAGFLDREGGRVMAPRTLFRLSSVTKPYVAVTALTLMEAGRLKLDAAVTDYLPTFRPRLADGRAPTITIAQLLTHTSGLTYDLGLTVPLDQPPSGGIDRSHLTLAENIDRIANVPLAFAPGTGWAYSLAIDVLGGVMEAIEYRCRARPGPARPRRHRLLARRPHPTVGRLRRRHTAAPDGRSRTHLQSRRQLDRLFALARLRPQRLPLGRRRHGRLGGRFLHLHRNAAVWRGTAAVASHHAAADR